MAGNKLRQRYMYSMQTPISHAPATINGPYIGATEDLSRLIELVASDKFVHQVMAGMLDLSKITAGDTTLYADINRPGVNTLKGDSGSKGTYTGMAKLIKTAEDFMTFKCGSVIISEFTNSSFTLVMSKAGAVVTEIGGTLSHVAIVPGIEGSMCYKLYKCHENYPRRRSCDRRWKRWHRDGFKSSPGGSKL